MALPALFLLLAILDPEGFLKQICPAGHIRQIERVAKCDVCPNWQETPDEELYFPVLEKVIPGHITSPTRNEALAYFLGCGGTQNPSFTILFRKEGTQWQKIGQQDLQLDACQLHQSQLLICSEGPRHRGFEGAIQRVFRITSRGDAVQQQELYSWFDSSYFCGPITTRTYESLELIELNGDGDKDIRTILRIWQGPGVPTVTGGCQTGVPTTYTLSFLFHAGRFEPTPETTQALGKLKAISAADHSLE